MKKLNQQWQESDGILQCPVYFYKQNTAYDMRISDWSSYVCSSDLKCEEEIAEAEQRFGIGIHRWDDIDLKNDMEAAFALTTQVDMVMSTSTSPQRIAE